MNVIRSPVMNSDCRDPRGVLLVNLGADPCVIVRVDRIAQMINAPVVPTQMILIETLDETGRGEGGFGSTGRD